MNKTNISVLIASAFILFACNNGSNSSTAPKYLPAGTYNNTTFTASCTNSVDSSVNNQSVSGGLLSADNVGNISDPSSTPPTALGVLNYAKSPCFSAQNIPNNNNISNLSITFQNCSYNSTNNTLSFTEIFIGTTQNITVTCTGPSSLTPASSTNASKVSEKTEITYGTALSQVITDQATK